jgi:hypothetical protein
MQISLFELAGEDIRLVSLFVFTTGIDRMLLCDALERELARWK